jgi:phosphate:Na+ symporter
MLFKVKNNNKILLLIILYFSVFFGVPTAVAEEFVQDFLKIDYTAMLMGFFGGIAFLLYGLDKMSVSLKALAGDNLKKILQRLTRTKFSSLMTGVTITAAIQSSAATTVMVVGFIAVQAIKLPQALGVILGADIGTTITVQLIAFKLNQYGLVAVGIGFFMQLIASKEKYIHIGHAILGVGMIFFGIKLISDSMGIIRDIPVVMDLMTHMASPFTGIAIGMILTMLMQSSAATLAVIIALASHNVLTLDAALILVLGANVGTCLTALIASAGKNRQSLQAAMAHIGFKVTGVLVALILFSGFISLISALSFDTVADQGIATARDVANAHMIFNIVLALSFLPFVNQISRLLQKLIPLREEDKIVKPQYLDLGLITTPSLALEAVRYELKRISKITECILIQALPAVVSGESKDLTLISRKEKDVDILYKYCVKYLSKISRVRVSEDNSKELSQLIHLANNLENISDIAGGELIKLGRKRIRAKVKVSKETTDKLTNLHDKILKAYNLSVESALYSDVEKAQKTIRMKHSSIRPMLDKLRTHQTERLLVKERNRFNTYSVEVDIIDKLKQIFYHSRKIAADVIDDYKSTIE